MILLQLIFGLALVGALYPYVVYPLILAVQAKLKPRPTSVGSASDGLPSVSVVVVAYNEAARIGGRVSGLAEQIRALGLDGEIVVVSDGSTDRTVAIAEAIDGLRGSQRDPRLGGCSANLGSRRLGEAFGELPRSGRRRGQRRVIRPRFGRGDGGRRALLAV